MHRLKLFLINYPFLSTASVAFYTFMGLSGEKCEKS